MAVRRWSFWMPAQDHGFIRAAIPLSRAFLTPRGRGLLLATLMSWTLGGPSRSPVTATLIPSLTIGGLLAGFIAGLLFRPRAEAERQLPHPPAAGQTLRYRVRVRNVGRRPIRALAVVEGRLPFGLHAAPETEGDGSLETLAPGESRDVTLAIECPLRGAFELAPLRVGSSYPSGLVRWTRLSGRRQRLVVYPRFLTQREFELPVGRRYQPGGVAVSSDVGDSTEFLGTRDYRPGDRMRDIHWLSYARSGRLIVKEYREEYFVRVGIVLDTELGRREPPGAFEGRVSLAAGIADALARRDHIIELFAAGESLHHLQAGRALARLENVLDMLACVEPAGRVDFGVVEPRLAQLGSALSSCVLLLADWDPRRARLHRTIAESGIGIRTLVVRDGPPSQPLEPGVVLVSPSSCRSRLK